MAALAYLLPPLSGLLAYLRGARERTRFHGLQSVAFGAAWPLALYAGAAITPGASQAVFGAGILVWAVLLVGTALGRDPRLPGGGHLRHLARPDPPRLERK
ncbi:MAG: hypothetical protein ACRDNL_03230 [Spirillospora sp.]